MKVCFPVQNDEGIESRVFNHFGSAPLFVVINTETNDVSTIFNRDMNHAPGACSPMKELDGRQIDAIIVGGIGAGALNRLNQGGIKVFKSQVATIKENIGMFQAQSLSELTPQQCCGGHSPDGGCAH